ncbi:MAG: hypothetical protein HY673_22670 [Chloroflexi bacterium]|nr:hypothetical protein [Chloroflexota bacterium]
MIFVECDPDAVLVEALTRFRRRDIIHDFRGKGELCNRLGRQKGSMGMVDEDPGKSQPGYMTSLQLIEDLPNEGVKLLRDHANNNFLVVLCPDLEQWTLRAARLAGIDVAPFKLPGNPGKLHSVINIRLDEFKSLVEALKATNSQSLNTLRRFLEKEPGS